MTTLGLVVLSVAFPSCGEKKVETVKVPADPDRVPTMMSRDVTTLISDSGMTRYRVTSSLWLVYDEAESPYWKFPNGLFLEKFDDRFDVEATVECDSATYFKSLKLWRLDGNVFIRNVKNERILTEQMFWDQSRHEVRSDSFVRIERSDRIIEGYGFRSDERLANYVILKPSGIFPVPARRDSLNAGSNENQN